MASYRTTPAVPADIITYHHGGKLVYVKPADNYEKALDIAQKEFPDELSRIDRDRISFTVAANIGQEKRTIRISESAWVAAVARLLRGEVIDIQIHPPSKGTAGKDAPPQYLEVPDSKEGLELPLPSRPTRSLPAKSRTPSPSGRSTKSNRSWFGKAP